MPCTFISYKNAPSSGSVPPIQIGSGTENLTRHPFYGLYDYSQMAIIYLASELHKAGANKGGEIGSLQFQLSGWGDNYTAKNQNLYLSHIIESHFGGGYVEIDLGGERPLNISDTTLVKSFNYTNPNKEDWEQFVFDTPFVWDGVSNILVKWENRDGSWESGYGRCEGTEYKSRSDPVEKHRSHVWFADDRFPSKASSWTHGIPNVRFNAAGASGHIH